MVDVDYNFRYIDVRCNGRIYDGGVFQNSSLLKALAKNPLNFSQPQVMADGPITLPYTVIDDDASPLKPLWWNSSEW